MSTVVGLEIEDQKIVNNIQDLSIQEQVTMGFFLFFDFRFHLSFPKCVKKFQFH